MDDGIHVKAVIRILWLEYNYLFIFDWDLFSFFFLLFSFFFFFLFFLFRELYFDSEISIQKALGRK